jgi:hypothetical protein
VFVIIFLSTSVLQAFAFTNAMASPGNTLTGRGTQFYIQFIEPSTFSSVTELDVTFPPGTGFAATTTIGLLQGLPTTGTVTQSGTTIMYTFAATSIAANTKVEALVAKVSNTGTTGAQTITYTLKNGATTLDTGTAPFQLQSPLIGSNFQLNFGNTEFGSHPCSVTITQSSYLVKHEPKISMINYLNGRTVYGQLAFADADPHLGEIDLFPYNFIPTGFMHADGSLLPISTNTALFSLLGTTFGGDGITNFALPDLRCMEPPSMEYAVAMSGVFPSRS